MLVPEELQTEVRDIVQKAVIKSIHKKKKWKKAKWCLRRPYKKLRKEKNLKAKQKRKDIPIECRVPKKSKER